MQPIVSMQPVTLRLCVLLSGWSRQILSAWLVDASSPVELLQTAGKPDDGHRRKTAITAFSEAKAVPRDLGSADFFAIGFYDSAYPELLKHIPDPPTGSFSPW